MTQVCNHCTVNGNNRIIVGNHNVIKGNGNAVTGNHNTLHGDNVRLTGNHNKLYGHHNKVYGNHNSLKGDNNISSGVDNKMEGKNNKTKSGGGVNFSMNGIAGNNLGGVQTIVNHGNYAGANAGSQINSFMSGFPSNTTVTVGRGIGVQSSTGGTIFNRFGSGGFSTVVIDDDDEDEDDDDSSSESDAKSRKRPDNDNNNNRDRDRSSPPPSEKKNKKIEYPDAWDDEPHKGIEGAKKCILCKTRDSVVVAWPCAHVVLCNKCCVDTKPTMCASCKKDVYVFKRIQ
jgi:hypothetical protein